MVRILELIKEGKIEADIARILDLKRPHVCYYVNKAEKRGFVEKSMRSAFLELRLTQAGKNFLDQYAKNNPSIPICRAENVQFKAKILQMPTIPVNWKKIEMHNWTQYSSQIDFVKVKLNLGDPPSVVFLPSPIEGKDPFDLFITLVYECVNVALDLHYKFGLKVDKLQLGSRSEWLTYDPIARTFSKTNGQVTYEGIGKVNASSPRNIGEFEFPDPRALVDYLLMPQRLKNMEILIQQLLREVRNANLTLIDKDPN